MSSAIPPSCKVLVIGGGPGGSYAAAALAREGVNTVLLEADVFPRYHIGESMLASMRHLLRFIELDKEFDAYGFVKKPGAAFKLNKNKREGYTDFIAAGGPDNYAWNVVRSESDNLMFQHASKSGAKVFDGVHVNSIAFELADGEGATNPGRPYKATYLIKGAATTGEITFDYVVDASGRTGIISTKYLKNRRFNSSLKNVATWGYWQDVGKYAEGTPRENSPFFEALQDETGWAWFIPLHNGTASVGIVMDQKASTEQKQLLKLQSGMEYYRHNLKHLAPAVTNLIGDGVMVSALKSASDYSYSASSYAFPYARIVGDAGCFIDPYFSSGVHLALTGGLTAALTICASIRGQCDEVQAAQWHSEKIAVSYTRFLLVVLSAYRQIRSQNEPVLSDINEEDFDRAFALFRPIIQGTADAEKQKLTQAELNNTMEFCAKAFEPVQSNDREAAQQSLHGSDLVATKLPDLSPEQLRAVDHIRARKMMRTEDTIHANNFHSDVIGGMVPVMEKGRLGLTQQLLTVVASAAA